MIGPIRGLARIKVFDFLSGDRPQAFSTFTFLSYFLTNIHAVDSFIVGYLFLKNFAACDAPLSLAYFAIVYLSSTLYLLCGFRIFPVNFDNLRQISALSTSPRPVSCDEVAISFNSFNTKTFITFYDANNS